MFSGSNQTAVTEVAAHHLDWHAQCDGSSPDTRNLPAERQSSPNTWQGLDAYGRPPAPGSAVPSNGHDLALPRWARQWLGLPQTSEAPEALLGHSFGNLRPASRPSITVRRWKVALPLALGLVISPSIVGPFIIGLLLTGVDKLYPGTIASFLSVIGSLWRGGVKGLQEAWRLLCHLSMGNRISTFVCGEGKDEPDLHQYLEKFISDQGHTISLEKLDTTVSLLHTALATALRAKERRSALLCRVCLDKEIRVLLKPCTHACLCHNCAAKLTLCPICREKIVSRENCILS